ncbi:hypothetical protein F53441_6129 [Fusarium austroafricanum]|uniref:Uncharacterized protein n=1 Tax=Fusarium austroafricanum TaxID=2364996 RepID=A0A8H4P7F6_9HYPO|nr:hypothetical protein F53441_6129 [Fusarium austroafricanum]
MPFQTNFKPVKDTRAENQCPPSWGSWGSWAPDGCTAVLVDILEAVLFGAGLVMLRLVGPARLGAEYSAGNTGNVAAESEALCIRSTIEESSSVLVTSMLKDLSQSKHVLLPYKVEGEKLLVKESGALSVDQRKNQLVAKIKEAAAAAPAPESAAAAPTTTDEVGLKMEPGSAPTEDPDPWADSIIDRESDIGSGPESEDEEEKRLWQTALGHKPNRLQWPTVAHTTSITMTSLARLGDDVGAEDIDTTQALDIQFEIVNAADSAEIFQPCVAGVLHTENNQQGVRSGNLTATEAREISFELVVLAMPEKFLELGTA